MTRFCANCGTEVDDTAIFCPTCGQPIDQEVDAAIPPAPGWPDAPDPAPSRPEEVEGPPPARHDVAAEPTRPLSEEPRRPAEPEIRPTSERRPDQPVPDDRPGRDAPSAPAARRPPPSPPAEGDARSGEQARSPLASVPVTAPVTLSGWLIGIGAALAAIGALVSLFDGFGAAVDLLLAVALGVVALTVFFSSSVPTFAHLRLTTLAIVLVAFGAGLDRLLTGARGVGELLLFLGTAAAVIGALILELGRDQPLGGSS